MSKPTVIDLFAGVGGLSLGFKQNGFEIVFANEYDKNIAKAYKKNNPETIVNDSDIRDINFDKIFSPYKGKIDVVVGGPPCQGFSQKGKRIGLEDERNFLFQQFAKVVEYVKPKYFVLENVPNILTAEQGFFKRQIVEMFGGLGYAVNAKVLKAEKHGVPQTRRRAVFLGKLGPSNNMNIPDDTGERTTVIEAIGDLPELKSGEMTYDDAPYSVSPSNLFQREMRAKSTGIYNHVATNHSKLALKRLKLVTLTSTKDDLPEEHRTKSIHSGTWTRLKPNGYARTITTRFDTPASGQFTLPYQDRCITVREAARLQSFPDDYIFYGGKSSQMLQVGNAVPPKLASSIAKTIMSDIKEGLCDS